MTQSVRALLLIVAASLAACAEGSVVATGPTRPATEPAAVRLYTQPPPGRYDVLGLVEARSDAGFTRQGDVDYAITELRRQAASIGANGVIVQRRGEVPTTATGQFVPTGGGGGYFSATTSTAQQVQGQAIYVYDAPR